MRTLGSEKNFAVWDDQITETLLQERTTAARFPINPDEVMPRYMKAAMDQKSRTKKKAEVFTPVCLVKKMEDGIDKDYEGSLEDYIKRRILEVTCGEAPFLTTRYDAATGDQIPVQERTGYLDRKLLCIPEMVNKEGYLECATEALKSVYAYEWQYDSLFLARRNLLMTTLEHYYDRFGEEPTYQQVSQWATIISYNVFRMDGVTLCFPETDIPAITMNWESGMIEPFNS